MYTIKNFTFSTNRVFMCFFRISEQTISISVHSNKWLVFTTRTTWL